MLPLTELGHSRQGQPNEMEGVKWESSPLCWDGELKVYHSDAKCSYLPSRGTYTDNGGMALYPSKQPSKNDTLPEKTEHKVVLLQRMGGCVYTDPLKHPLKPFI